MEISAVGVPAVNGSSVVLTCTLSSNESADTATYAWYRAEDTNEDAASASGSGQSGGNIQDTMPITRGQNFTFSPVTFSDQGFYVCGATFDGFVEELSDPYTLYGEYSQHFIFSRVNFLLSVLQFLPRGVSVCLLIPLCLCTLKEMK